MKAKLLKELVNNIPDEAEVLFEYSTFIFGESCNSEIRLMPKSELRNREDEFEEDLTKICDYLICFEQ